MKFTEATLKTYAAPLSETENEKCKRVIAAIRDALKDLGYTDDFKSIGLLESDTLAYAIEMRNKYSLEKVHIFLQGSYANNTCVRNESDVDIAVVREDIYENAWGETVALLTEAKRNEAKILKDSVERVLRSHFPNQVHRGNKSIKVDGNTYRKKADTIPCIGLKYYNNTQNNDYINFIDGVVIYADDGSVIKNFPKQHIKNGKEKNIRTHYYYKRLVRIIKKMKCLMSTCGYSSADKVSSFGLESLLWNIPDVCFTKYSWYGNAFSEIINYLYNNKSKYYLFYEANGIKKLCLSQADINAYSAFIDDLRAFFNYVT